MEREKRIEDIKNLLLKIAVPLLFPLAGSAIFSLISTKTTAGSDTDSVYCPSKEEEEEMSSSRFVSAYEFEQDQGSCSADRHVEELVVARRTENREEIMIKKVKEDPDLAGEMENLKYRIAAAEERSTAAELRFHQYCDTKEQESAYQKMQIMCLGLKLESLETQNQTLEAAIANINAAAKEFAAMRSELSKLQNKFKKISKDGNRSSRVVNRRLLNLERGMEEMRESHIQLQKERGANENVEVMVERSTRRLSSQKDLLEQLEALRARWASDMEEMIYLGWITAWLQHQLMANNDGEASATSGKDVTPSSSEAREIGDRLVAGIAGSDHEVEHCNAEMHGMDSGMDVAVRKAHWSFGRTRMLHRVKGWATGKGKCKWSCNMNV